MNMGIYSKFIAPERRSAPTPARLAEDGKCVFGTFESEFEHIDLLDIKNPVSYTHLDVYKRQMQRRRALLRRGAKP